MLKRCFPANRWVGMNRQRFEGLKWRNTIESYATIKTKTRILRISRINNERSGKFEANIVIRTMSVYSARPAPVTSSIVRAVSECPAIAVVRDFYLNNVVAWWSCMSSYLSVNDFEIYLDLQFSFYWSFEVRWFNCFSAYLIADEFK